LDIDSSQATTRKVIKPFGTWPSDISAEMITRAAPGLNHLHSSADKLFWVESRPWEAGRNVIMCKTPDGAIKDLLPAQFSCNSKVHEYGGVAYTVANQKLYFVNALDQRIYQLDLESSNNPSPVSPEGPFRFADIIVDTENQRLIAVCEHHIEGQEPDNYIAAIALDQKHPEIQTLVAGSDFYAYPRLSPDNNTICWIEWQHPHMPWDNTQLWQASVSGKQLTNRCLVAGGNQDEAIFQPQWSPDNLLYFVSDSHNWWNIYRLRDGHRETVLLKDAEFAVPLWQLGVSTYDFIDSQTIGCTWTESGVWFTGLIDIPAQTLVKIDCHYSSMHSICTHHGQLFMMAGAPGLSTELISFSADKQLNRIYSPASLPVANSELSTPESVLFPSADDQRVHAFFYPPINACFRADEQELPLVIAICHGGPTGATDSSLNLKVQYWTNRGFAVVDINYRGSTGFGRHYRQGLTGAWGLADVEDAQYAIGHLASLGKIDSERCIIRGGSAGGYTVLSALTFTDTFKAGASLYGIGDLETLATDTHKFESRYLDSLIGPYPERKDIYIERSPINHIEGLNCPVIFLQGLQDKVVPPNQAEMMVDLLQSKGIKVAYVTFDDEGHGFRKANNIIRAMEAELAFYQEVFNLVETI
jgi:dipeptidyl aminopeptidase/acylaminoacyl peptidase